jgi:hypothetical protein
MVVSGWEGGLGASALLLWLESGSAGAGLSARQVVHTAQDKRQYTFAQGSSSFWSASSLQAFSCGAWPTPDSATGGAK